MEFNEDEKRIMRMAILGSLALIILVLGIAVVSILCAGCTASGRMQQESTISSAMQGTQDMTITLTGNVDMDTGDVDLVAGLVGKSAATTSGQAELRRRSERRTSPDTSGISSIIALVLGGSGGIGAAALIKRLLNKLINSEGGQLFGPAIDPKAHALSKKITDGDIAHDRSTG